MGSLTVGIREGLPAVFDRTINHMEAEFEKACSGLSDKVDALKDRIADNIGRMIPENQRSAPTDLSKKEVTKKQKTAEVLIALGVLSVVGINVCGILAIALTPWLLIPAAVCAIVGIGCLYYYCSQSPDFDNPVVRQEFITRLSTRTLASISDQLAYSQCSKEEVIGYSLLGYKTSPVTYAAFSVLNDAYQQIIHEQSAALRKANQIYENVIEPSQRAAYVAREREELVCRKYDERPGPLRRTFSEQVERDRAAQDLQEANQHLVSVRHEAKKLEGQAVAKIREFFKARVEQLNQLYTAYQGV